MVISTAGLNRIIELDTATGLVTCEAGVSLEQLMVAGLPAGWFVPVSPGTRQVTVGGAIAADVHGKNHHVAGSFARHVRSFELVLPGGEPRTVTEQSDPALFWATAGGMGLTGLITRATVQLKPVASSRVRVDTVRTADIDETMAVLAAHDRATATRWPGRTAWPGAPALGRSVVTSGDFAEPSRPARRGRQGPVRVPARRPAGRAGRFPARRSSTATRWAWPTRPSTARRRARAAARSRTSERSSIRWMASGTGTSVYGPGGFRQYQYVVPFGAEAAVRRSFELVSQARAPSFVTVLKRFGPGDPGPLSFPMAGWTLALDFPARTPGLAGLLGCPRPAGGRERRPCLPGQGLAGAA